MNDVSALSYTDDNNSDFEKDVKLAVAGDSDAFSRLYSLVYKDMYHIARYNLRSSHDASDAVSDAVADAFESIKNLRNEKAFRSWIMKILYAKIKRKQKEYLNDNTCEYEQSISESENFNYEYHELKIALESLDEKSKMILSMSVINGYTSLEIARICKINPATVRSRLMRIKKKLRLNLEESD